MYERVTGILILNSSGGGIATTLDSSYYKGQGIRQGIEREYIIVISESDRLIDGEQSSRKLLRAGRIQRHVRNGEEE